MSKFVPGFIAENYLLNKLKCSSCARIMKPPIYRCHSDHPVCNKCWIQLVACPKCCQVYQIEHKQDIYGGYRIYDYKCINKCTNSIKFNAKWGTFHCLSGTDPNPYVFMCSECGKLSGKLYRYNGSLLREHDFLKVKASFKPLRCPDLEALTEFVLYPCELKGCSKSVSLAEQKNHEADCMYRCVNCPSLDCEWNGPLHSLIDHVSDVISYPYCALFALNGEKTMTLEFVFPSEFGSDQHEIYKREGFVHSDEIPSIICVTLYWSRDPSEPLKLSMEHIGLKSVNAHLTFEIGLGSKLTGEFLTLRHTAQNDSEAENGPRNCTQLCSLQYLRERGFVDFNESGWKIVLQIIVHEERKNSGWKMIPIHFMRNQESL